MGNVPNNLTSTERYRRQAKKRIKNNFPKGPDQVDWVQSGRVQGVRDQASCGSCW